MRIARAIAGFLLGYAFVVLTTEFGFRPFPQGRASLAEGPAQMALATLVAVIAGLGGGALAAWVSRSRIVGALVAVPLTLETFWLFLLKDPPEEATLFEVAGAITLIACTIAGAFAQGLLRRRSPREGVS